MVNSSIVSSIMHQKGFGPNYSHTPDPPRTECGWACGGRCAPPHVFEALCGRDIYSSACGGGKRCLSSLSPFPTCPTETRACFCRASKLVPLPHFLNKHIHNHYVPHAGVSCPMIHSLALLFARSPSPLHDGPIPWFARVHARRRGRRARTASRSNHPQTVSCSSARNTYTTLPTRSRRMAAGSAKWISRRRRV